MLKRIPEWYKKHYICSECGASKSVKYVDEKGKHICNACALLKIKESK